MPEFAGHPEQISRLLHAGGEIMSEHGLEGVLEQIVSAARQVTGSRYAALGVLDEDRTGLQRFLTGGIDVQTSRQIGDLPRGRGVLGVLIRDPRPLRLADVHDHPQSYGFPLGHPPMRSFLGVPIIIRGEAWGNLYLTEKADGEFTAADEEAIAVLAGWAAIAIDNARLYERSEQRRLQLERAVRSLEASRDIATAIGASSSLDEVLELVVKRGRALIDADSVLIMLRDGEDLVVAATAGHARGSEGLRLPLAHSTSGRVLAQGLPERFADAEAELEIPPRSLGVPEGHCALLVPMVHRGQGIGVLAAFDRRVRREGFGKTEERLLLGFAASAGNAVALNRSVHSERLRAMVAAADSERSRWARELHDETLQSLGALRIGLSRALSHNDPQATEAGVRQAIADVEAEIANLRAIIADLRPAMLDDLGLLPALETLVERRRADGLEIRAKLSIEDAPDLDPELETAVYRVVQEGLTNVVKHAHASLVELEVALDGPEILVALRDDGSGFDPSASNSGVGLVGMRERVELAGGTLELDSGPGGTTIAVRLAARARPDTAVGRGGSG